jgi:hypothetical protein
LRKHHRAEAPFSQRAMSTYSVAIPTFCSSHSGRMNSRSFLSLAGPPFGLGVSAGASLIAARRCRTLAEKEEWLSLLPHAKSL